MREIKFRAWNKETQQMIDLQAITPLALSINPAIAKAGTGVYVPDHERLIIMQYTGRLDKNGQEIYEGDIVNGVFRHSENRVISAQPVIWHYTGWYVGYVSDDMKCITSLDAVSDIEVIGHIYENPR